MSEQVISYHSRRFVVEVGHNEYDMNPYLSGVTVWAFERAFHELRDAESYAERVAEDNAHVRIVDRGEEAVGAADTVVTEEQVKWQYGLQDSDGFVGFRNLSLKSLRKRAKLTGEKIVRRRPATKWEEVSSDTK